MSEPDHELTRRMNATMPPGLTVVLTTDLTELLNASHEACREQSHRRFRRSSWYARLVFASRRVRDSL